MIHNRKKLFGAILLAGYFLLAAHFTPQSFAAETTGSSTSAAKADTLKHLYDDVTKKSYGPKADIVWNEPTKVFFSHTTHTRDLGFTCSACHPNVFTMKAGRVLDKGEMTMAAMAEGKFCGTCHDGNTAFASNTQCASCHMDVKEIAPEAPIVWTKPVKAVIFDHKAHTEDYGLDCDSCHDNAFTMETGAAEKKDDFTMQSLYDGKYCGMCHDGSTAFASNTRCNSCHIGLKGYNRLKGKTETLKDNKQH